MDILTEMSTADITLNQGITSTGETNGSWNVTETSNNTYRSSGWYGLESTESITSPVISSPVAKFAEIAISEADARSFSFVSRTIVNPIVCVLGFVGNSLGVGVLWRQAKQQKLSIFWYLCALTVTDNIFLGLCLIDSIPRIGNAFHMENGKYLVAYFRLGLTYLDNSFLHSARYIVVVMSCERLLSVVKPLHVKDSWFAKYPIRLIVACILFNLLFNLPLVTNATIITKQVKNMTEYLFTFKNYDAFMAKFWVIETAIHSFFPTLMLVIINVALPLKLYRTSTKLRSTANKAASSQQKKVTAIVLTITIMYIFLSVPFVFAKTLQYVNPDFNMQGRYRLYFWFMVDLGRCLAYINGANDFPIYFLVSNNYREAFKAMYCKRCRKSSKTQRSISAIFRTSESKDTVATPYSAGLEENHARGVQSAESHTPDVPVIF